MKDTNMVQYLFSGYAVLVCSLWMPDVLAIQQASVLTAYVAGDLASLFDEEVLSDNIHAVRRQAREMAPQDAYQFLKRHVLPDRSRVRLGIAFTSTNPVDPVADGHPDDLAIIDLGTSLGQRRIRTGGRLVSPALDLVEVARRAEMLKDLKAAVLAVQPSGEIHVRSQLSLLALIDLAADNVQDAAVRVDELYRRFLNSRLPTLEGRTPETLLLNQCVQSGRLLDESLLFLTSIVESQIRESRNAGPDNWNSCLVNLWGRARLLKRQGVTHPDRWTLSPDLKQWHWATRSHSWSSGMGFGSGHLIADNGRAEFYAKHDDEFLFFTSPLRGNYTLECECSLFGWKEIHPFVGGVWMTPVWHHETLQIGNLLRKKDDQKLEPRLSAVNDSVLFRVDVRDGVVSRYLNSRLLMQQRLPQHSDPWLVIRNLNSGMGQIKNVRIYGEPVVPDHVVISEVRSSHEAVDETSETKNTDVPDSSTPEQTALIDLPPATSSVDGIHGWLSWHEGPWNPVASTWKLADMRNQPVQIVGTRRHDVAGVGLERLLRYQWPLVWDSEVRYEFYYDAGVYEVHPVIGRQAILLRSDGVKTHWITNGYNDLTDLDPMGISAKMSPHPSESQRVPSVPLKNKAWNQATLSLVHDTIRLTLNGMPVFESDVSATNDRSFGLFHYADQTEARVRNVVLTGDWPKTVPLVMDQELRGTASEAEDLQRNALPASLELDFTTIKSSEFSARATPYGMSETRASAVTRRGYELATNETVNGFSNPGIIIAGSMAGDFDAIAEFADLKLKVPSNGVASIRMIVQMVEAESDLPEVPAIADQPIVPAIRRFVNYQLFHGMVQHPDTPLRGLSQVEITSLTSGRQETSYPKIVADDCTSGRLRLIRKGDRLSYWVAPLDSPYFRLLYSGELPNGTQSNFRIFLNSFCYSSTNEPASVFVTWKKISVRADRVELPGAEPLGSVPSGSGATKKPQ